MRNRIGVKPRERQRCMQEKGEEASKPTTS